MRRARNWKQLELHHQPLLDDFAETCAANDARDFLRYVCAVDARSWYAPFATLSAPLPRGKARAIEKGINKRRTVWEDGAKPHEKHLARDWMLLVGTRYGRQVDKAERLLFFSAIIPYMNWRRGSVDWNWLARFVAATEGSAPGKVDAADSIRAWWKKNVTQIRGEARSLVAQEGSPVAQRRRIQRHLLLKGRVDDAAWAYVRFLNSSRPASERSILPGRLFHRKSAESKFVRKGLIPVFGWLRERPFTAARIQRLKEDGLLEASEKAPNTNWIEVLPRVQHAGLKVLRKRRYAEDRPRRS